MISEANIFRHWTELTWGARENMNLVLVVETDIDLAHDAKGYLTKDVMMLRDIIQRKFKHLGDFNCYRVVPRA